MLSRPNKGWLENLVSGGKKRILQKVKRERMAKWVKRKNMWEKKPERLDIYKLPFLSHSLAGT